MPEAAKISMQQIHQGGMSLMLSAAFSVALAGCIGEREARGTDRSSAEEGIVRDQDGVESERHVDEMTALAAARQYLAARHGATLQVEKEFMRWNEPTREWFYGANWLVGNELEFAWETLIVDGITGVVRVMPK